MTRPEVTEELKPCRQCGSPCRVELFPAHCGGPAVNSVWLCSEHRMFGGSCASDMAYLSADAWNTRRPVEEGMVCGQDIAPVGWWCSRNAGHEGPCAAHEKAATDPLLLAEGALRTARHAILRQCDTFKAEVEITAALWHIQYARDRATQAMGDNDG